MKMSPEQWEQVKDLYDAASECDSAVRSEFLRRGTTDEVVYVEVRRLLAENESVGSFLSVPPYIDPRLPPEQLPKRFAPGEILAERFRVIAFIASGGMGEVYEAEDLVLKETLAIKTIRTEILQQGSAQARFKREVHLARKVTHPNICRVFDLFWHKSDGPNSENVIVFVSMELLKGETLAQRIRRTGRLSTQEAGPLINQIASGLEAAHRAGVVHRDLKPGNVILVPDGSDNKIRSVITDFGLALRIRSDANVSVDLTGGQGAFGTPAYMAPEQIEGSEATQLADIYALGLIAYEMVTGEHAYPANTPLASAAKRLSDPPISPKHFVPELSHVWEKTISRCLQRDPKARFPSALDVANALSSDESISAEVLPSQVYRRYGRLARIALAVVVVLAVLATAHQFRDWFGGGHPTLVHAARRPTVAVLGFNNLSGKSDVGWIDVTVAESLGAELAAGDQLRIIPSEQVALGKIDLGLKDDASLGHESLTRLRNNIGSDFVVDGSFLAQGDQVRVNLTLQDAVAGETIDNFSELGREQDLNQLIVKAGDRLRRKLGLGDSADLDAGYVAPSQSSSFEATRLYSEGLKRLHSFDSAGAKDLFQRAIVQDPNYALAHSALAEAWRSLGYDDKSANEAKRALDLAGSLPRDSRLVIEAQYRNSTHELVREAEIYKTLFNLYPDNLEYGLSLAKSQYFNTRWQEADETLDTLQQLPPPEGDDPRIDLVRSSVAISTGDNKQALTLSDRIVLRAQQKGSKRLVAQALKNQCLVLFKLGDPTRAEAACENSRAIFSEVGDSAGEAGALGQIAFQAANRGDMTTARTANDRQIALLSKIKYDAGLGYAMTVAGELSGDSGDYTKALQEYTQALNLYQKVGYQSGVISSYGNLGWIYSNQGNLAGAVKSDREAVSLTRRTNNNGEMDLWLENLADDLLERGDVADATKQLEEGFSVNQETGDKRAAAYLHTTRSKLLLAEANFDESRREAELAIKLCRELNDEDGAEERSLLLAKLDIEQKHPEIAAQSLRNALSYFGSKKDRSNETAARAILIEALLALPSNDAKRELSLLAGIAPATQKAGLRLSADLAIAQARIALGDLTGAQRLLINVTSESKRLEYESIFLEAELAQAEIDVRNGRSSSGRAQIVQIQKQAEARGLGLIARKARALSS
jgi:serine/threonine protein kinase/tetratricopeptide (TPR) repeat protein